jgi:Eukaryotic aspartyl protease
MAHVWEELVRSIHVLYNRPMLMHFSVDSTKSSTFKTLIKGGFSIQYVDKSGSSGDYFSDAFEIGGAKITALQMGLAFKTTVGVGIMGIGYDTGESVTSVKNIYPNLIDQMVSQGQINTKLYSLYLDDLQTSTGSIVFGGIDTKKYVGTLKSIPVQPETTSGTIRSFTVLMTSVSFTTQNGTETALTSSTFSLPVILDSGTTITYVPQSILSQIITKVGGVLDPGGSGIILVDCDLRTADSNAFISFGFGGSGGPIINVPISEVIRSLRSSTVTGSPFKRSCTLGIKADSIYLLGDTFLRSAYVVYDLKNNMVGLAQTNFEATDSNIVEVAASATAIPSLTGVATGLTQVPLSHFSTGATASATAAKTTGKGVIFRRTILIKC